MVEWKADGKCVIRVMSDGTIFTGKMADAYTKGNERERELLIIGWNEAMAQAEAEIEKLREALKTYEAAMKSSVLNQNEVGRVADYAVSTDIDVEHLRAAAAALKETE